MLPIRIEFTIGPFIEGGPGPHVTAAIDTIESHGFVAEIGPLGTAIEGEAASSLLALAEASTAAFEHGATSMNVSIERNPDDRDDATQFLDAVAPVLHRLGAVVVSPDKLRSDDEALMWGGRLVGGVRTSAPDDDLLRAAPRLIAKVEREMGGSLATLSRENKQRAAHRLDELGAFNLKNATEVVAHALGVSRMTVYNYLSATRARASVDDDTTD